MSRISKLTADQFSRAVAIFGELSPENLTCDGMLSRAQMNKRWREIMKRLTALEKEVGFHIEEREVWDEYFKRQARGNQRSPFGMGA